MEAAASRQQQQEAEQLAASEGVQRVWVVLQGMQQGGSRGAAGALARKGVSQFAQ